jgi:hypothetical protein
MGGSDPHAVRGRLGRTWRVRPRRNRAGCWCAFELCLSPSRPPPVGARPWTSRDNALSARSLPVDFFCLPWTSSASPGLLLPPLDFFCLPWTSSAAVRCWALPPRRRGSFGGRRLFWWLWTPPVCRRKNQNSVLPPVSLLGDQWTHAPTNAYACGLLPSSPPVSLLGDQWTHAPPTRMPVGYNQCETCPKPSPERHVCRQSQAQVACRYSALLAFLYRTCHFACPGRRLLSVSLRPSGSTVALRPSCEKVGGGRLPCQLFRPQRGYRKDTDDTVRNPHTDQQRHTRFPVGNSDAQGGVPSKRWLGRRRRRRRSGINTPDQDSVLLER